jgi:hypothetical protein
MSIDPVRYRLPEDLKTNRCDLGATRGSAFAWLAYEGAGAPGWGSMNGEQHHGLR